MAEGFYQPKTEVNWSSPEAFSQFKTWRREVDRILKGPLSKKSHEMRMNYVYIWAGGVAEELVESKKSEDPTLKVETADQLLDALQDCLTHSTFFREACEQFYALKR